MISYLRSKRWCQRDGRVRDDLQVSTRFGPHHVTVSANMAPCRCVPYARTAQVDYLEFSAMLRNQDAALRESRNVKQTIARF